MVLAQAFSKWNWRNRPEVSGYGKPSVITRRCIRTTTSWAHSRTNIALLGSVPDGRRLELGGRWTIQVMRPERRDGCWIDPDAADVTLDG